jgi:radical SAM protein with 4Fe4S-binding SPASM domain
MSGSQAEPQLIYIDDAAGHFRSWFNPANGYYLRTGILDERSSDTGAEPFRASFPHLLDIGIMGHCVHGLSGLCEQDGFDCYQDGAHISQPNMSIQDFESIAGQCQGKVFQFALGGRGDPDMHESFEAILSAARERGIVPSLTTSGWLLTPEKAALIKKYCGAAAVSWYGRPYTLKAIELLLGRGVKTNIHYVLSSSTISQAIELMQSYGFPQGINRVIFLLYKPVGTDPGPGRLQAGRRPRGASAMSPNILKPGDPRVAEFFRLVNQPGNIPLVGFDSCCVPALIHYCGNIDPACYDACEAARFSAYITPDLNMLPCSFGQRQAWAVSLHSHSIADAWESLAFESFRASMHGRCPACPKKTICLGGCPIRPEIVLCADRQRRRYVMRRVRP